jgi:hypothetical protein
MIEALNQIVILALQTRELDLYKKTVNLIAHLYLANRSYLNSLVYFKKLRDAASEDLDYPLKLQAYQ